MQRGAAWLILAGFSISLPAGAQPDKRDLRVATASNFVGPMRLIADRFEELTGQSVTLIVGSTGKHYAQVVHGAPFDILFAADTLRPALLENQGVAIGGTRFTYAVGKLALWSSRSGFVDSTGHVLLTGDFRHLAIANPTLAPYGAAARQTLEALGLWDRYERRLVRGENISHTFNFVRSGNAELGFVALSQVADPEHPVSGSYWVVPQAWYAPIEQQAVLITDSDPARRFLSFVRSDEALSIIHAHGYETP
jgi:molybdate transport system substrate-binding protein